MIYMKLHTHPEVNLIGAIWVVAESLDIIPRFDLGIFNSNF